jgi:DNA-binding CsgD family transcriptional regulator/PAS domain-containing protein
MVARGSSLDLVDRGVLRRNHDVEADWEILNDLIGRIYECALDPGQWNDTLAGITTALCPLQWESAFLIWEGHAPAHAEFVAASGLAAGVQEMYTGVYAGTHLWSQRLMRYRNGSVVDTNDLVTPEEFARSPFARDFLAPWGIGRMVAVMLDRRGQERLGLMLPGPADRDLEGLKRGLRVLAPHIQRAVRISERIASLELAHGAAKAAVDTAPFGLLSLDASLNILSANKRVAYYEKRGAISTQGNRLAFLHPASQRKLLDLLKSNPPAGLAFQAHGGENRDYPVLGARMEAHKSAPFGAIAEDTALIITIGSAPGETPVVAIDRVAQWFDLTPAEARLAVAIAEGQSLVDYAAQRAVTVNATRFLLKGVFRKTGVSSQAQLAALVARLPTAGPGA